MKVERRAGMAAFALDTEHSDGVLAALVEEVWVWLVMGSFAWPAWIVILP